MILIQSQLCRIDQSDLFIPRSRGGVEINPAPPSPLSAFLFSPHSASLFPACLSSSGCARVYTTYAAGKKKGKPVARQIKLTSAHEAIFLHSADTSKFFCSLACCVSLLLCLFFCFFVSHLCPRPRNTTTSTVASPRRLQDTRAMLKPARTDR